MRPLTNGDSIHLRRESNDYLTLLLTEVYNGACEVAQSKPFFVRARFALPASYLGIMSVHLNNLQLFLYMCVGD